MSDRSNLGGRGVTRRRFLTTMGAGTIGAAAAGSLYAADNDIPKNSVTLAPESMARITLNVNRQRHTLLVEPRWTLLYVLRERIGLTGSKEGCSRGECGACTVLIDDVARYACMTLAVEATGREITTIEGLLEGEELGPVQKAFAHEDAYQCGYCTPGQMISVEALLRNNPTPSVEEIRRGVSGNLCRCGAYVNIFKAAGKAAEMKRS